jgi:hypothetical protein
MTALEEFSANAPGNHAQWILLRSTSAADKKDHFRHRLQCKVYNFHGSNNRLQDKVRSTKPETINSVSYCSLNNMLKYNFSSFAQLQNVRLILSEIHDYEIHIILKKQLEWMHHEQQPSSGMGALALEEFCISPNRSFSIILQKEGSQSIICTNQKGKQDLDKIGSILKSHGYTVSENRCISDIVSTKGRQFTLIFRK